MRFRPQCYHRVRGRGVTAAGQFTVSARSPLRCGRDEVLQRPETRSQNISRWLGYNVAQKEINAMAENSVVRARIDERTKREAAAALKKIGLTVSDAFRLLLVRVAAEKALPFEPLNPNAETVAAMKAARRGELVKVGKPDKLLRSLNAGD
ncbi:Addiction module antitoxin, RelB/DinJ family (modular protein) [Candidatus Sulfopaludibacter sp. SbA4]|nr:Addiction module antitoxin, RelB/DinJ family (modular protein) [Candidatus Sulfopaludibacter sp. SbA4]